MLDTAIQNSEQSGRALRVFSKFLCLAVAVLLFLGANVKSHEAGLAVPDWPTSYGYSMFTFPVDKWIGGIFHEHVHRLAASAVGMLTVLLTGWTFYGDRRHWVRWLTLGALLAVIAQGVLGGLTVKYLLPLSISTLHGTLGQIFFCLVVLIAYAHSREFSQNGAPALLPQKIAQPEIFRAASILLALVFVQLVLGNLMRHSDAGLAVPDFPTMAGSFVPSLSADTLAKINMSRHVLHMAPVGALQVAFHLAHRLWALVVLAGAVAVLIAAWRHHAANSRVTRTVYALAALVLIQMLLGISVLLTLRSPLVASFHVVTGALLLATTLLLLVRSARLS